VIGDSDEARHRQDNATDLTDWWMSEKLDGVRAFWDGQQFLSR
jgi:DNA ligase 1